MLCTTGDIMLELYGQGPEFLHYGIKFICIDKSLDLIPCKYVKTGLFTESEKLERQMLGNISLVKEFTI